MKYKGSYLSYFLMYMFYYFGMALFAALISTYLLDMHYSASQVSLVVSAGMVMTMILQPIVGSLNDRFNRKAVNSVMLTIAAVAGLLFSRAEGIISLTAWYSIGLASISAINPVIERMATTSRHRYSAIRIWGTVGYATGSQAGGWIYSHISPQSMYVFCAVSLLLCLIGFIGTREDNPIEGNTAAPNTSRKFKLTRPLIVYLSLACLFGGMTSVSGTYVPAMYQSVGLNVDTVAFVLFLGTMMELPIILLSRFYMNRFSNRLLLQLSFVMLMLQFAAYAFVPSVPIRIIATFFTKSTVTMAFIMINIKLIATLVDPRHQMTALAMVSTVRSLVSIGFQSAAGMILDASNYSTLYGTLFAVAIAAFVFSSVSRLPDKDGQPLFT